MSKKTLLVLSIIISGFVLTGCLGQKKSLINPPTKQQTTDKTIIDQSSNKDQKIMDNLNKDLDEIDNLEEDVAEIDIDTTVDFGNSKEQNQLPVASDNKIEINETDVDSALNDIGDLDKLKSELNEESLDVDLGL